MQLSQAANNILKQLAGVVEQITEDDFKTFISSHQKYLAAQEQYEKAKQEHDHSTFLISKDPQELTDELYNYDYYKKSPTKLRSQAHIDIVAETKKNNPELSEIKQAKIAKKLERERAKAALKNAKDALQEETQRKLSLDQDLLKKAHHKYNNLLTEKNNFSIKSLKIENLPEDQQAIILDRAQKLMDERIEIVKKDIKFMQDQIDQTKWDSRTDILKKAWDLFPGKSKNTSNLNVAELQRS